MWPRSLELTVLKLLLDLIFTVDLVILCEYCEDHHFFFIFITISYIHYQFNFFAFVFVTVLMVLWCVKSLSRHCWMRGKKRKNKPREGKQRYVKINSSHTVYASSNSLIESSPTPM